MRHGWDEQEMKSVAAEDFRYSPSRNSLLGPIFDSDNIIGEVRASD